MDMYPLLLKAPVKDYLWGGTRLKNEFGFETTADKSAEAWVLSCHKDGTNTVINGSFSGMLLTEVLEHWGGAALGKKAEGFSYFPLLIKLIDAKDRLSVQVHPDDVYALENEGEYGKTEAWYIVDCEESSQLIYGFKREISKAEFEKRIKNNTLDEVVNYVPVHKGDVFFISAGTLHAIGAGILVAEVQQNSNTTYRVSDYGRLGADGKPRELHVEKALDVTKRTVPEIPFGNIGETVKMPYGSLRRLVSCDFFTTELILLDGELDAMKNDSFMSFVVLDGYVKIRFGSEELSAKKGESLFVPAGLDIKVIGSAELICSYI